MIQNDKAGTAYWNENWAKSDIPKSFDHTDQTLNNYVNLEFHKYFQKILEDRKGFSVLEIGCANSMWPIYFHQYFKADVYGIDYSEIGCQKSRTILKHYSVPGEIYNTDLFSPPADLLKKFDLVISFGVVEHFEDTAGCLEACSSFVKPGGKLLTIIPNIPSIIGFIQKYIDRSVYDVHVPLTKKMLTEAHKKAEIDPENCDYFMSINLNIVNSGSFSSHSFNKYLRYILSIPTKFFWSLEKYGLKIPNNSFTSPYIIAVANVNGRKCKSGKKPS